MLVKEKGLNLPWSTLTSSKIFFLLFRYVSFEDSKDNEKSDRPPQYEMKEFGHQDVPSDEADENDSLIRRSLRQKKKKKEGTSSGDRPKSYRE